MLCMRRTHLFCVWYILINNICFQRKKNKSIKYLFNSDGSLKFDETILGNVYGWWRWGRAIGVDTSSYFDAHSITLVIAVTRFRAVKIEPRSRFQAGVIVVVYMRSRRPDKVVSRVYLIRFYERFSPSVHI